MRNFLIIELLTVVLQKSSVLSVIFEKIDINKPKSIKIEEKY
jgi:hypothetical protein